MIVNQGIHEPDYQPKMDEKSKKMLANKESKVAIHDRLINSGKEYKQKREEKNASKQSAETDVMMDRPKILNKSRRQAMEARRDSEAEHKCHELFNQADRKKTIDRRDRRADDIAFEKAKEEFTFQPNKGLKRKPFRARRKNEKEEEPLLYVDVNLGHEGT